jgi:2-methylcitrate dehydratase PrpD
MIDHGVTLGDRASHLTSLPYQLAVAALMPEAMYDVAQSPANVPEPVAALMAKTRVTQNERLLARYPKIWPAHVRVAASSGAVHEREVEHIPGDIREPFDTRQVRDKFRRFVTPMLGEEGATRMLSLASTALDREAAAAELVEAIEQACGAHSTPPHR